MASKAPDGYELLPGGFEVRRHGSIVTWSTRERHDPKTFKDAVGSRADELGRDLDGLIEAFVSKCRECDPVALLFQILFLQGIDPNRAHDPRHFAGKEAILEFLAGLALSVESPGTKYPDPSFAHEVVTRFPKFREMIELQYLTGKLKEHSSNNRTDNVRFLLGLEGLLDRTEGFVPHLEALNHAVFGPIHNEMQSVLGFSFADLPRIVPAITALGETSLARSMEAAARAWDDPRMRAKFSELDEEKRTVLSAEYLIWLFSNHNAWIDLGALARRSGVPLNELVSLLNALSATWGAFSSFRSPLVTSPFRDAPVLKTERGIATLLPFSLLNDQFRLFERLVNDPSHEALRKRYLRSRDQASEEVARSAVARVFSSLSPMEAVEYEVKGRWVECDGLLVVPPVAVLLEVKAGSLTLAGRRGAPKVSVR